MIICKNCGSQLEDSAKYCRVCGAPAEYYTPPRHAADRTSISGIYHACFAILKERPALLWGLSLLNSLLCILAAVLGVLPIVSIPLILVLTVGIDLVYMNSYRGEAINSAQLFTGFKNFFRFCGGMAWMLLWIFIWGLIPVAGIVFAVIKAYSYRFVPFILLTDEEIAPMQALKRSMEMSEGCKGRMFGADIIVCLIVWGTLLLLFLLGMIPYLGIIFGIIRIILTIAAAAFCPLILGLFQAAFFVEISNKENERNS